MKQFFANFFYYKLLRILCVILRIFIEEIELRFIRNKVKHHGGQNSWLLLEKELELCTDDSNQNLTLIEERNI